MCGADGQAGSLERNSEILREEFSKGCGGSDSAHGDVGLGKRGAESTEESYKLVEACGQALMSTHTQLPSLSLRRMGKDTYRVLSGAIAGNDCSGVYAVALGVITPLPPSPCLHIKLIASLTKFNVPREFTSMVLCWGSSNSPDASN